MYKKTKTISPVSFSPFSKILNICRKQNTISVLNPITSKKHAATFIEMQFTVPQIYTIKA